MVHWVSRNKWCGEIPVLKRLLSATGSPPRFKLMKVKPHSLDASKLISQIMHLSTREPKFRGRSISTQNFLSKVIELIRS
jgi:hypothetical protein